MKFYQFVLVAIVSFGTVACNQGDERLAEKARIEGAEMARAELKAQLDNMDQLVEKARNEGRAAAEAQLATQNENWERRSKEMESDLSNRQRFYQAMRGTYEGQIQTEQGVFRIKMTLVPSLPPYSAGRVRQLDEIASDLNNLHFNTQVVQWNPVNPLSAVGCRISQIRPDIERGEISIASESCPNLYSFRIAGPEFVKGEDGALVKNPDQYLSDKVAGSIKEGKLGFIPEIRGEVHPTTNAAVYEFSAMKKTR